jgi:diacylglycerol kinase (ATP)
VRIVILYNPISGAGRAALAADKVAALLREHGHSAVTLATRLTPTSQWLDPALQGKAASSGDVPSSTPQGGEEGARADLLVVAGGDGAMRLAAPAACRINTAVYHLPFGTENLFAREFGMNRAPGTLLAALERQQFRTVDVGLANGHCFLLMVSVGFDAEVVHQLASTRSGAITHSTYLRPILATMRTWSPPTLEVDVDGARIVHGEPGMLVIANSRQYGWRIDPAWKADMSDGLLDVVFLPARTLAQVVMWALRCRMRRQFRHRSVRFARGRNVLVRSDRPQHFQLDGDPPGVVHEMLPARSAGQAQWATDHPPGGPLLLQTCLCPGLLRVLTVR